MPEKKCPGCGKPFSASGGAGQLPGTKIVVCADCYRDSKRPN